jgi:Flp pilus assembly pilin Flp
MRSCSFVEVGVLVEIIFVLYLAAGGQTIFNCVHKNWIALSSTHLAQWA